MTKSEMRVRLGLAPEDDSEDGLIGTLLSEAEAYVRAFCRLREEETVPDFLIAQMALEDFGRLSGAGVVSRTVSGASEYYRDGYSKSVMAQLYAMRHPGGREGASL